MSHSCKPPTLFLQSKKPGHIWQCRKCRQSWVAVMKYDMIQAFMAWEPL